MNIQISNYEQIDNIGKGNIQIFGKYSLQDQHNYLIIIAIYTCERKKIIILLMIFMLKA